MSPTLFPNYCLIGTSLCIPKIHYRFSKLAFSVSPKVIIISSEGLQEASMHLCVRGIVGYTQIKRHRGRNVCEHRDERGTCVWGGASPHFVRHRGHIKFNAEPNCTLVFVESGCLFVCGGMTFWMREEGTWSLSPLQRADCSFARFCVYSHELSLVLFIIICLFVL